MDGRDLLIALVGLTLGCLAAWLVISSRHAARLAALTTERDLLRARVDDLEGSADDVIETAQLIAPLRDSLSRMERQVHTLERDRTEQFAVLAREIDNVRTSTDGLRDQTASLVGSLSSSTVRGTWGEVTLRRVLEVSGLVNRCDFDTQVSAVTACGRPVRPDVVVHLPGERHVALDSKAPMTDYLAAQADGLTASERDVRLKAHARSLRSHVDALAGKAYWSSWSHSPDLVVCFVPGEAFLAGALAADPGLHEHAMARKVVLASPSSLMALLRVVALSWQQEAITEGARELYSVGRELYARLATLGEHTERLGGSLRRSVEAYNALVGSFESRVLVATHRMQELGLADDPVPEPDHITITPRGVNLGQLAG